MCRRRFGRKGRDEEESRKKVGLTPPHPKKKKLDLTSCHKKNRCYKLTEIQFNQINLADFWVVS